MKNDFRYRLLSFMQGRYGYDAMSKDLMIIGLVITLIARLFNIPYVYYAGLAIWIFSIYRTYSRNIYKRQQEFTKYCRFKASLRSKLSFKKKASGKDDNYSSSYKNSGAYRDMPKKSYKEKRAAKKARKADKDHIYFNCEGCGLEMRVPRGVGKIEASCPRCRVKKTINTN